MASRTGNFAAGTIAPTETPSLMQRDQKFNSKVPGKFTPNGLNQPVMLDPGNGNGPKDATRQTPNGELPDSNGMSQSTYSKLDPSLSTHLNF